MEMCYLRTAEFNFKPTRVIGNSNENAFTPLPFNFSIVRSGLSPFKYLFYVHTNMVPLLCIPWCYTPPSSRHLSVCQLVSYFVQRFLKYYLESASSLSAKVARQLYFCPERNPYQAETLDVNQTSKSSWLKYDEEESALPLCPGILYEKNLYEWKKYKETNLMDSFERARKYEWDEKNVRFVKRKRRDKFFAIFWIIIFGWLRNAFTCINSNFRLCSTLLPAESDLVFILQRLWENEVLWTFHGGRMSTCCS